METPKEFYRRRLIELTPDGIIKTINKVVNIDREVQICQEYAELVNKDMQDKINKLEEEKSRLAWIIDKNPPQAPRTGH